MGVRFCDLLIATEATYLEWYWQMSDLSIPVLRERTQAAAMHVATIFFPIVAPVVAMLIGRSSPYVNAHARRSLRETILIQGMVFFMLAVSLIYGATSLYFHYLEGWKNFSLLPIIARFIVGWTFLGILEVINTISALRNAHWAYQGVWPGKRP